MNVYLDNASTTMVREEAIDAMTRVMSEDYGNPSSLHGLGRRATDILEKARSSVAEALGSEPRCVYFTSGGTEANNLAILGALQNRTLLNKGKHIITSAVEHSSVLSVIKKLEGEGFKVTYLAPDKSGHITAGAFAGALREDTVFASVMLVNNETGAVNPVSDYSAEIKRRSLPALLHTDAVQGLGKISFNIKSLGADLLSVSAHKVHGPKGVGALYAGKSVKLSPLMLGGGQENDIRHGTEALPAIAGFGEAALRAVREFELVAMRQQFLLEYTLELIEAELPAAVVIGDKKSPDSPDSPFILCLSLPGFKSEVLMNYLDGKGVCVSNGAACKKGARSHTLEAMGLPGKVIDGALRLSFSRYNTYADAKYCIKVLKQASKLLAH